MTSSVLNLMPMLNQEPDYASLGQWGKAPLMEIPGVTTPAPPTALMPMSLASAAMPDYRTSLYSDVGYGGIGSSLPIPDSNLIGSSAGSGSGVLGWLGGQFNAFGDFAKNSGMVGSIRADGTRDMGWGGLAVGAASSLMNGWMGYQNLKVAKDQLRFQKDAFAKNWSAQKTAMNSAMEDRQRARVASNSSAYESVDSYMAKNRIA